MNASSNIISMPMVVQTAATEFHLEAGDDNIVTIKARPLGALEFDATIEVVNNVQLRVGRPIVANREDGTPVTTAPVTSIRWADAA